MSKFGRFAGSDRPALIGTGPSAPAPRTSGSSLVDQARATAAPSKAAAHITAGQPVRFAIALDATGSMSALLQSAKESMVQIMQRVSIEAETPVEIELFAYRDYDCGPRVLERSGPLGDPQKLKAWLERIQVQGGGANDGEAIEAALEAVMSAQHFRCTLVAGDEPSNSQAHIRKHGRKTPTAIDLAGRFAAARTPIHTFVVGQRASAVRDFKKLAERGGGCSGRLDGSREMIDMAVMAMLASLKGGAGVRKYMDRHQLSLNSAEFGEQLLLPAR